MHTYLKKPRYTANNNTLDNSRSLTLLKVLVVHSVYVTKVHLFQVCSQIWTSVTHVSQGSNCVVIHITYDVNKYHASNMHRGLFSLLPLSENDFSRIMQGGGGEM